MDIKFSVCGIRRRAFHFLTTWTDSRRRRAHRILRYKSHILRNVWLINWLIILIHLARITAIAFYCLIRLGLHINTARFFFRNSTMACGVSHQHHCLHLFSVHASYCFGSYNCSSNSSVSPLKCSTKCGNGYHSARFRTIPKASANKNPSSIPQQPKPRVADDRVNARDPDTDPNPNSLSVLHRLREQFKLDGLGVEILSIALPAALALDADPITSLVDTGFVGHLGSAELAAVGVSGAVFNLVSKLFDVPLLNITTSYVAEEQASVIKAADGYSQSARGQRCKMFLPSVLNAIVLAAALGIIEAVALSTGSSFLMDPMGFTNARTS